MALHAEEGDKFWTRLERMNSSGSKIIAHSPYKTDHVLMDITKARDLLPDRIVQNIPDAGSAELYEAVYVAVDKIKAGTVYVRPVHHKFWPEYCPLDIPGHEVSSGYQFSKSVEELFQTNRDEPIEWEGTKQNTTNEAAKGRQETFNEEDIRGSKNDHLNGHL